MTSRRWMFFAGAFVLACVMMATMQAQGGGAQGGGPMPAQGGRRGGGAGGGSNAVAAKGTLTPLKADSRGWGFMSKSMVDPAHLPLYNLAKQHLFEDKQVTSYTISRFDPELYCETRKHFDYIWFEMQHSTMSWDEVAKMIAACPGMGMAAPMVRMPDAQEANMQKVGDMGNLGFIVPTVDDAIEARDAGRFARFPPIGRRSSGAGQAAQVWNMVPGGYANTINDNMLVVVMIETIEGTINAAEIASQYGVDVIIEGNNDLSRFSGWSQNDDRYQDFRIRIHDAALKAGKYYGSAGQQYLTGNILSPDVRFVQNGPAKDGWTPPARGRGPANNPNEEPVIGMPGRGR